MQRRIAVMTTTTESLARRALGARSDRAFEIPGGVAIRGFTLIELMVTLAIVGILLTVVAPSLRSFILSNELVVATNDFVGELSLARSEALKRRTNAIVCKSGGGSSCVTTGTWDSGWIVFADVDGDGAWSSGDQLMRTDVPKFSYTTLTGSVDKITFDRNGKTGANSSFTFCSTSAHKGRQIAVSQFGRHTIASTGC